MTSKHCRWACREHSVIVTLGVGGFIELRILLNAMVLGFGAAAITKQNCAH